ncbi:MAG: nucleotidyltransferase domain-containing protein [Acidobacteriia bacterium]|nr:nucleotidyltransferase domain-containing protein [Terriglobia bacterium]
MGESRQEPAASDRITPLDKVLSVLQERAKELKSIYTIDEILQSDKPFSELLRLITEAIPAGWQYPQFCQARIIFQNRTISMPGFYETRWVQRAPIFVQGEEVGSITVAYTRELPEADEGPFLKEEYQLIKMIADRIGQAVLQRELRNAGHVKQWNTSATDVARQDWRIILDLLKTTDPDLFKQIARKMLNYLSINGIGKAKDLLRTLSGAREQDEIPYDENRPLQKAEPRDLDAITEETFLIAAHYLAEQELLSLIQIWIKEDRVNFLVQALEAADTSLVEIANAMERFQHTGINSRELSVATQVGLKTSLVRRLLTDDLDFIETSRKHLEVEDFFDLLKHTILVPKSHGKLGGKTSGLFLASHILQGAKDYSDLLTDIRIPKTWYLPSDMLLHFLAYNNLDDVYNWKYLDIDQIREEYPHILQVFKSSRFPPDILQGISTALDDFGDHPLIVRSSSLLEDRMGAAFSGKYKSLFLANQGERASRLAALLDALAEVYASVFSPDPIQYRAERGLLDQHEEMGIMIQEVVGTRVGRYFFPAFSGVGFSNNEFRWSPRIKREDGLLRLVPGLGTRAVDRVADDYPILVAPGQPHLRVNVTPEETIRYAPKKIDVIDLADNAFRTMELSDVLADVGAQYPGIGNLISIFEDDRMRTPNAFNLDFERDDVVITFEGLIARTPFLSQMKSLFALLRNTMRTPVDIEFACDGSNFYLLQCRPQSYSLESVPSPIPRDIPESQIIFSANRYVSNGKTADITHVVYVDPDGYSRLTNLADLQAVGRAVSNLNKILPKRKFILMGPGRWGSRGDIKLGVSVTYSDINNTAVLVEIARKTGGYVPDLSFGTHFFQDLVESGIRYLPLYPDDAGIIFKESFLRNSPNILPAILPEYAALAHTIRVIDVPRATGGRVLRVLMNADQEEAVGMLAMSGEVESPPAPQAEPASRLPDDNSRWRIRMAQKIAAELDAGRFGVKGVYVIGSTKNGTAGPEADIDLIVHFDGTPAMKHELEIWLEGWSLALAEMNYLRTGYKRKGLLDVRIVTQQEIAKQTGFAAKIGAVTDPARCLTASRN